MGLLIFSGCSAKKNAEVICPPLAMEGPIDMHRSPNDDPQANVYRLVGPEGDVYLVPKQFCLVRFSNGS